MAKLSGSALDSALIKTTYLALSVYDHLAERYGHERVRLQPYEIDEARHATGRFGLASVRQGEYLQTLPELVEREAHRLAPGFVTVDLFSYVDPFYTIGSAYFRNQRSHPSSYGATLSPLVSVHAVQAATPRTLGGVAMSADLLSYASTSSAARDGLGATIVDYMNGLKGVPLGTPGLAREQLVARGLSVYPQVEYFIDQPTLRRESKRTGPATLLASVVADIAGEVDAALARISRDAAQKMALVASAALYDRGLAARLRDDATTGVDQQRLEVVAKFAAKEREFLGVVDKDLVEGVLHGEWGQLVRETMVAEQGFAAEYAAAREQHEQEQMMSALTFAASSLRGVGSARTPMQSLQRMSQMLSMSVAAVDKDRAVGNQLAEDFEAFNRSINYSSASPLTFTFEVFGRRETVTASNLAELRAKMRALYHRASSAA